MPNFDCGALPLEIVQEIIKWGWESDYYTSAIQACSLVSRLWREASLKFLFHDITFRDKRQLDGWDRWLKGSPKIVQAVRRVQFFPSCLAKAQGTRPHLPHLPSMTVMPGVTDLEWCFYSPTMFPESDLVQFLHNFPNLRNVTLASEFANLESLKSFLGACGPNIATLELRERLSSHGSTKKAAQNDSNRSKSPDALDLPKLEHLVIGSESSFLDWVYEDLFAPCIFRQLRSLAIETEASTFPTLNQIFEACSPTLLQLKLDPTNIHKTTLIDNGISLRPLPDIFSPIQALTKLAIGPFHFGDCWEPESVLDWVCAFLGVLQAENLVVLELLFYAALSIEVRGVLKDYDWGPLVTLIRKKYKKVQELVLWIIMEMEFGGMQRERLEQQVRTSGLSKFVGEGKHLNVKYTMENPSWGWYSGDGGQ